MRRTPDNRPERPVDVVMRLQQLSSRRGKRRKPLLHLAVALSVLAGGLVVTAMFLWPNLGNSSRTKYRAEEVAPQLERDPAHVPSYDTVELGRQGEDVSLPISKLARATLPSKIELDLQAVWEKVRLSLVRIESETGVGSGFVVGQDLVATNHHVVVGDRKVTVYFQDGTSAEADGFADADAERDLAVVRVTTGQKAVPLRLAQVSASIGDQVAAISHFERIGGEIVRAPDALKEFVVTTAKVKPGFSGGPLVDHEGDVVGMLSKKIPGPSGSRGGLAVPVEDISNLLDASRYSYRSLPVPGIQVEVRNIVGERSHGVSVCRERCALVTLNAKSNIQDCGGHGVYVQGKHNTVIIRAGKIRANGGHGVFVWGDNNTISISGGEIDGNTGHGVLVEGDNNVISVAGCRILDNHLRGLDVEGDHNEVKISGGTILGKNGGDVRVRGDENTWTITGGVFGDDGSNRGGQQRTIGHQAKLVYMQGVEFLRKGKSAEAIKCLNEAILLGPEFANFYSARGSAYGMESQHNRALKDFGEAIRLNPKLAFAYTNRANVHYESKDFDKAIDDFTLALQLEHTPDYLLELHAWRSRCFIRTGDSASAIDDVLQAMRLKLEAAVPYAWRSDYYSEGIEQLSDAIEEGNTVTRVYLTRGSLYYKKGDLKAAIEDWTKVISRDSDQAQAYAYRALAYEKEGESTRAAADRAKARELIEMLIEREGANLIQ